MCNEYQISGVNHFGCKYGLTSVLGVKQVVAERTVHFRLCQLCQY